MGCAVHKGGLSPAGGLRWKGFGVREKVLGGQRGRDYSTTFRNVQYSLWL